MPNILQVHGTSDKPAVLAASQLLRALVSGHDVDLRYCRVDGDLRISAFQVRGHWRTFDCRYCGALQIHDCVFEGEVSLSRSRFDEAVVFEKSTLKGPVWFYRCEFRGQAGFRLCQFRHEVDFYGSQFRSGAYFEISDFALEAHFDHCWFAWEAILTGANIMGGASFHDCVIDGAFSLSAATIQKYLSLPLRYWGHVPWWRRVGRWFMRRQPVSQVYVQGTDVAHCTSSLFRRWVADWNYLSEWSRSRPKLYRLWMATSDCGRSFSLWLLWAVVVVLAFGLVFSRCPPWPWLPQSLRETLCRVGPEIRIGSVDNWFTPYYFSIVTMTTLGFGDVVPLNMSAQVAICAEVVAGYLMLGGLVAILAQKFARRA